MGMFTHSSFVVGPTGEALAAFYQTQGTRALILRNDQNRFAICDDNDDEADLSVVAELTDKLQVVAILGQVFDSSAFVGTIYDRGRRLTSILITRNAHSKAASRYCT